MTPRPIGVSSAIDDLSLWHSGVFSDQRNDSSAGLPLKTSRRDDVVPARRTSSVRRAGGRMRDPGDSLTLNVRDASFQFIARRMKSPFLCANVLPSSSYRANAPLTPG